MSEAVAEIVTKPLAGRIALSCGEVIFTSGGIISDGLTLY